MCIRDRLEPTNEWYAIAKIAGIKLCQAYRQQYGRDFISAMPTNLYGPNDNFDLTSSHVLPALIRKFHDAKVSGADEVEIWGTGSPMREFLHVDDLAERAAAQVVEAEVAEGGEGGVVEGGDAHGFSASFLKRCSGPAGEYICTARVGVVPFGR